MIGRLPVRLRLTLWFTALLAVILLAFGGIIFFGLRERLYDGFDEQLRNQAAVTLTSVRVQGGKPILAAMLSGEQEGEYFLRLVDSEGRVVIDNAAALGGVALDGDAVNAALAGQTRLSSIVIEDDETFRIATVPVRDDSDDGVVVGALQVGLDRDEIDEVLDHLTSLLALAAPLALAGAGWAGYVLAARALAPVADITNLAASISGKDLHARLNLNLPDDELGRLARTFDGMLSRIEDAFEQQRRFTTDAAHELRTPLSLMRSQIELALSQSRTTDEYREALSETEGDLTRLTGLVATLLTLARADTNRLSLEAARFDLADTVGTVVGLYAPLAEQASVKLHDTAAPTPLVADEDLLVQVLVNLLDNALAHTPAGGSVTVGCRRDGTFARLWVEDTGAGIAAEHQARVFDRFYRVDAGRTRVAGGTGLGLAMCRAITEAHGGTIELSSRPGIGTRVEVVVPADSASERDITARPRLDSRVN